MNKLLLEVKKELIPSKQEEKEIFLLIKNILKKINKNLKDAKAIIGGSGEKGTWLKDAHDSDIFVLFNYNKFKNKTTELSDILEKHLKKSFKKITRIHGSRDYFQIFINNSTIEIIPILHITKSNQALNITDISPLHTKWVKKHIKYQDEIRLTKKFCKANKIYGAESYIQGYSGYVCEILTIYYKTFKNLLKAASKWKERTIIDIAKHHRNVDLEVNKSKLVSPLIVIDPVQAGRNASAALSNEKYHLLIELSNKFLKSPNKDFFIEKKLDIDKLKNNKNIIILKITSTQGKRDVVGSKLLKTYDFLRKSFDKCEFIIKKSGWEYDQDKTALLYFIFNNTKLSKTQEWPGPPIKIKNAVKIFKKKYKNTYIKNNRVFAKINREYTDINPYLKNILKDEYLKDKIVKTELK